MFMVESSGEVREIEGSIRLDNREWWMGHNVAFCNVAALQVLEGRTKVILL